MAKPTGQRPRAAPAAAWLDGLVVASFGRHCLVESVDGSRRICHPRGKKSQAVVGDRVHWLPSQDEGSIEVVLPRRNLFFRQDEMRTKSFAANLDQILVLIAAEPEFSGHQLARALIAAHEQGIEAVVALNKRDLAEPFARARQRLKPYVHMGYRVLELALATDDDYDLPELHTWTSGKTTLVLGPSGAGKSTLVNRLVPGAAAQTGEISQALNTGRHTTTRTTWYWVDAAHTTALLDSPGFQEFGLHHIEAARLASHMPDLNAHAAACRFYNCSHLHEPGCAVISAVKSDPSPEEISESRYKIYCDLRAELDQISGY
jgi:ribosome biogenesis GTPase